MNPLYWRKLTQEQALKKLKTTLSVAKFTEIGNTI